MEIRFGCVVEGYGEVRALPELLRRIAGEIRPGIRVSAQAPFRVHRDEFIRKRQVFEAAIGQAKRNAGPEGAVLVLLDSEGFPPCDLAPELLARIDSVCPERPHGLVLAHRNYEAWLIAAAESLSGKWDFPPELVAPRDPEAVGGKKWIQERLPRGRKYTERTDQATLTRLFDIHAARQNAPSFDKLWREVERLLILCCR